ncbi:hypothetical protein TRIHO_09850 [Tritonibacter horizontis]|uniref:Uncharacterized protein n=1 Tax=Tritonibacter horizontis TaxID=1768241 RepID=A0A132C269_9RHOB|nr:hypothetical protein TRIHO_09850 [Tritonibacter horizontis]
MSLNFLVTACIAVLAPATGVIDQLAPGPGRRRAPRAMPLRPVVLPLSMGVVL